jgi:peptidoglycan hydrolase CwlO-like protein
VFFLSRLTLIVTEKMATTPKTMTSKPDASTKAAGESTLHHLFGSKGEFEKEFLDVESKLSSMTARVEDTQEHLDRLTLERKEEVEELAAESSKVLIDAAELVCKDIDRKTELAKKRIRVDAPFHVHIAKAKADDMINDKTMALYNGPDALDSALVKNANASTISAIERQRQVQEKADKLQVAYDRVKAEAEDLKRKISELEVGIRDDTDKAELRQQLQETQAKLASALSGNEAISKAKLKRTAETANLIMARFSDMNSQGAQLAEFEKTAQQNDTLHNQNDELRQLSDRAKQDLEAALRETLLHSQRIKDLERAGKTLQGLVDVTRTNRDALQKELNTTKNELSKSRQENNKTLQTQVKNATRINDLDSQNKELAKGIREALAKLQAGQEENENLRAQLEIAKSQKTDFEERYNELEVQWKALQDEKNAEEASKRQKSKKSGSDARSFNTLLKSGGSVDDAIAKYQASRKR